MGSVFTISNKEAINNSESSLNLLANVRTCFGTACGTRTYACLVCAIHHVIIFISVFCIGVPKPMVHTRSGRRACAGGAAAAMINKSRICLWCCNDKHICRILGCRNGKFLINVIFERFRKMNCAAGAKKCVL